MKKNRVSSYDVINTKLGQKGPEFVHYVPIVIERSISYKHSIFKESNSFLMSVFEHYKILMPPHPLLPRCGVINHKFGQERC